MITEIAETEDPYDLYKALSPETKNWEVAGRIAFLGSSFVGVSAFVPAVLKKNRVYTFSPALAPHLPPPPDIAMAVGAEEPLPPPHCTREEHRIITELFTSIADGGANLALPWVFGPLIQQGNEIEHVHPFALLLALPREKIREILRGGNPLKIGKFTEGLRKGMERELGQNNVDRYIAGFAAEIGKEEHQIRPLIQRADWLGLAQYLFDIPGERAE